MGKRELLFSHFSFAEQQALSEAERVLLDLRKVDGESSVTLEEAHKKIEEILEKFPGLEAEHPQLGQTALAILRGIIDDEHRSAVSQTTQPARRYKSR